MAFAMSPMPPIATKTRFHLHGGLPRSLFYSLRSNDIVWTRGLESLVAGAAHENRYAAWPDRLMVLPATEDPADRI